jgi:hypothetical protein
MYRDQPHMLCHSNLNYYHACICYNTISDAVLESDWRVISVGDVLFKRPLCYTAELADRDRERGNQAAS